MDKQEKKKIAVISIMSYYARQIFDETKQYEFRKSPIGQGLIGEKIYVYSAKEDKAIIGYFRVSDILRGNTNEILRQTGYDKRPDRGEIVKYFGDNNPNCFALQLYDVTEFDQYLSLGQIRSVAKNADMPQYIRLIPEDDPLYEVIKDWDEAFSLDGTDVSKNPNQTKNAILQKARMKGGNKNGTRNETTT